MTSKKQVIVILFAAFLIMLYISMKARRNSVLISKISNTSSLSNENLNNESTTNTNFK
jgi:hypothetical protein